MPTVARIGPYRLYFFSHEPNEPPHVHVDRESATLKVWLLKVDLARSRGFRPPEIGRILQIVEANRESLLEAWHDYFGTDY
jgi:Domain of unknown function (DUF4160)